MSLPFYASRKTKLPVVHFSDAFAPRTSVKPLADEVVAQAKSSLVDLRSPELFRAAFIPGSYNISDLGCVNAAKRCGFFERRRIYLLADQLDQLQLCSEASDLGSATEIAGWFGTDAIEEWQKSRPDIGSVEAISGDTLAIRAAAWNTLVFDIHEDRAVHPLTHPGAMRFCLRDLPLALDGLPAESSICLTARTTALASFAASLLWNFGFRRVTYLQGGCRMPGAIAG